MMVGREKEVTDKNGSIDEPHTISSKDCQCIYAGPVELIQD